MAGLLCRKHELYPGKSRQVALFLVLILILILIFILHLNRFPHSGLPSLRISMSTSLANPKLQDYGEEAGAGAGAGVGEG